MLYSDSEALVESEAEEAGYEDIEREEREASVEAEAEEAEVQKHCGGPMAPAESGQRLCEGHMA